MNERFGGFRQTLVVCLEPSPSAQPRKGSLDDPAPRQNCEAALSLWLANDFQPDLSPWPEAPHPVLQTAAGISAISPNYAQAPEFISRAASTIRAAARSCALAAVMTTRSTRPSASTSTCRLRPETFFPAS